MIFLKNRPGGMRLIRDEVRFGDGPAKKVLKKFVDHGIIHLFWLFLGGGLVG